METLIYDNEIAVAWIVMRRIRSREFLVLISKWVINFELLTFYAYELCVVHAGRRGGFSLTRGGNGKERQKAVGKVVCTKHMPPPEFLAVKETPYIIIEACVAFHILLKPSGGNPVLFFAPGKKVLKRS